MSARHGRKPSGDGCRYEQFVGAPTPGRAPHCISRCGGLACVAFWAQNNDDMNEGSERQIL